MADSLPAQNAQLQTQHVELEVDRDSWLRSWIRWKPTSRVMLAEAEHKLLHILSGRYQGRYIPVTGGRNRLWTICINGSLHTIKTGDAENSPPLGILHHQTEDKSELHTANGDTSPLASNTPLVLIHGMGGGVGLWSRNLATISQDRALYAFDLLGFGRSSRPNFSYEADIVEEQFVQSVEDWREAVGLENFVLLGHSLGGFVAAGYAMKYPDRVKHLVLVDPWGFPERPAVPQQRPFPLWVRALATLLKPFNPLAVVRAAGPWGPGLIRRFRPDLEVKFAGLEGREEEIPVFDYIYHCNAQPPSGETAFSTLSIPFGWAKNPMIRRIHEMSPRVPLTMIYGSRSWVDSSTGYQVKYLRNDSHVDVQIIKGAGHHVYAEKPEEFNTLVRKLCKTVDEEMKNSTQHREDVGSTQ
ncbi:protein ABHD4 [Lingula anatina]|uniref:Protein ABHD4 n=1 Tax=Lingula anatina TaxID=7574 RepID=A0A1S3HS89_LINAN|nr:protein ABHD4 [Lingula anatina]|eukprot:XP_013387924.1 protein ABHD4 [Lingula anatina]